MNMNDHPRITVQTLKCPRCGEQAVTITKTISQAKMVNDDAGLTMAPRKNYMKCKACNAEWYAENYQFVYYKRKNNMSPKAQTKGFKVYFKEETLEDKLFEMTSQLSEEEQNSILKVLRSREM